VAAAVVMAAPLEAGATAAPLADGAGTDTQADATLYCTPDGGPLGAFTDSEHTVLLGDQPLPAGVRRSRETVDGVSTPVMQAGPPGSDEAVVFIHGVPGSSRDFDGLVGAVGQFARAVAFDMPGFGHADKGFGGSYTQASAVRFVNDMLDHLGIRRVHLALHDFGGIWALDWAAAHTDRLAGVVLIDTGVLTGYRGNPPSTIWNTPVAGELEMAGTTRQSFNAANQFSNPRPFPSGFLDRMYDDYDRGTRCAILGYVRSFSASAEAKWEAQQATFSKLRLPALVIWGDKDPYIPPSQAENQKNAFPAAEVHVIPNAGHWPFVDEPELTRSLVVSFLRRTTARRPAARAVRHLTRRRGHHGHRTRSRRAAR
jgi:pimeloyl-ACP methyl ester carboxylesterase